MKARRTIPQVLRLRHHLFLQLLARARGGNLVPLRLGQRPDAAPAADEEVGELNGDIEEALGVLR